MADQRLELFHHLRESLLTTTGDTSAAFRTALAHRGAQLCNGVLPTQTNLPPDLETYVEKVALHAYRVTDQDVERLHAGGLSEDAIFEITLSVALGVSMNCLEQGLAALEGAKHALE